NTVTESFGSSEADDGNYVWVKSSRTPTPTIAAATLTASGASAANKTYDATTVANVTGGILSGVLGGDTVTLNQSGTFNDKNVGEIGRATGRDRVRSAVAGNYVLRNTRDTAA